MTQVVRGTVGAVAKNQLGIMVNETWYNIQNKEKQFENGTPPNKGDSIAFQWEQREVRGRQSNVITSKVKVEGKAAPKSQGGYNGKGKGGGFQGGKGGFGGKSDPATQDSIVRQSSLNYATALVAATLKPGADAMAAADLVVKIAKEKFYPFAHTAGASTGNTSGNTYGSTPAADSAATKPKTVTQPEDEFGDVGDESASDGADDEFEDDVPF